MKRRHKLLFCIVAILLIASVGIVAYLLSTSVHQRGYRAKIIQLWGSDLGGSTPSITNRTFVGNANASITLVAYLDMTTESSQSFLSQIYPQLQNGIASGAYRFYHKHHITVEDIATKDHAYIVAQRIDCLQRLDPGDFNSLYPGILQGIGDDVPQVLKIPGQYNFSADAFQACVASGPSRRLQQDAEEVTAFGFQGIGPQLVIGVQGHDNTIITGSSATSIQQTIQRYQIQLGFTKE